MQLRNYKSSDCSEIAVLFYETVHTVNKNDYTKEQLDVWATGNIVISEWNRSFLSNHTVIIEKNSIIIGFGDMDKSGYLDRLYVHKDFQKQGVASLILSELEAKATLKSPSFYTTMASITAKPFFQKKGYSVVRENVVYREGVVLKIF